jgi:hypothetical protein
MLAANPFVTAFLAVFSVAYVALSVRVSRSGPQYANNLVSFFLVLVGGMLAGSAFSYSAVDSNIYAIGRTLSFGAAGFVPVVFYLIYREYTVGLPNTVTTVMLCIIPVVTVGLALTNSSHGILWVANETPLGLSHSDVTDHYFYRRVFAPYTYGLFGYCAVALIGRLPSIALASLLGLIASQQSTPEEEGMLLDRT